MVLTAVTMKVQRNYLPSSSGYAEDGKKQHILMRGRVGPRQMTNQQAYANWCKEYKENWPLEFFQGQSDWENEWL